MKTEEYNIKNEKYSWENQQQIRKCKRWISNLEDMLVEITQSEQEKKNFFNEDSLRDLWDNIKQILTFAL